LLKGARLLAGRSQAVSKGFKQRIYCGLNLGYVKRSAL
jgi:hypothetical protein